MEKHPSWLVMAILLFAASGDAQTVFLPSHRAWEFSVFGGGSFIGDRQFPTPVTGSSQETLRTVGLHYGTGPQLGVRMSEIRWDHWGADFDYSYSNQPLTFTNLSPDIPSLGLGHSIHRFIYDVDYYPFDRRSRLRPFAFAGAGVSLFYLDGSSKSSAASLGVHLEDQWKFTFSWGGGVKYLVMDHIAFSFRFADNVTGVPGYGLPRSANEVGGRFVPGFTPDGYQHNWLVAVAFDYQWGQR